MNPRRLLGTVFALLLAAVASPWSEPVRACGTAPPRNKTVAIADESAIIIWDEANKTQHFIRRASFNTDADDFGFLVPTPTQPDLAEASDEAFTLLAKITAPRIVWMPRPTTGTQPTTTTQPTGCLGCGAAPRSSITGAGAAADGSGPAPVRVLEEKRVAGYDAKVLEADDPNELVEWLNLHKYEVSPALTAWVTPYVNKKWKITAFKIAKDKESAEEKSVATSAVRMTFQTDHPFFPYREPAEPAPGGQSTVVTGRQGRLLRVFFVSDSRVEGKLGQNFWPGKTVWANKLEAANRDKVLELLKLTPTTQPKEWWLTEFEDFSSPRPGTDDVYFTRSADQWKIEREPNIQYVSNGRPDLVIVCAFAVAMVSPYFVRGWRRRHGGPANCR